MKSAKFILLTFLSSSVFAEATPVQAEVSPTPILPIISFEAQQKRVSELVKQSEYTIRQEEVKRIRLEKLQQTEHRIQQEAGQYSLQLLTPTAIAYLESDFNPLWENKDAERLFLKEYAVFAASGISTKAAQALVQILNTSPGLTRDILLTDSFLDYLYYNQNALNNANQWLYELGSYRSKAPDEVQILLWVNATRNQTSLEFVQNLIPKNHIYQETVSNLFELNSSSSKIATSKKGKTKKASSISSQNLALNALRLRLIPSFNNGIFVNIPSYQLYYFRDGQLALQSKVIVGRNDRRTPVMYSKLSNVVVNPPWNVPITIKNKDLVPKIRKDPSYAERNGYEIFDHKGNRINPHSIVWESYDPNTNFPYHIRQKAGDDSALGRYKFNMPSTDAIYLHDTPKRELFSNKKRALSSGCVRVAKSDELATLLLKEAGWNDKRKQSILESKKTTSAHIRSDNPVYLYYVTAWVENGKIHTLPDIYNYDVKLPNVEINWEQVKNQI
ncbi:L,D-transpeptidase-like protein [Nicoletella semolina]|uniref:L,D-transpeptidase-like protein n=1 Tax=Nicoletella semolina TaxID=271160 RepID=A0A4R2NC81_9PAST|nr:L,D-transpeptidase family protein [Nicoletella semolina]MDH2924309.1 L,D-transpeptidase [Nicoletella semolina]TCP18791.1 L,D-transpeptidase-like protein [Nicoletella semolina]